MLKNRIIIDFDDTISITLTRDWENAEPVWPVINKINELYERDWEIIILTARGQLSCKGDFSMADKKYRSIIEAWLNRYGVKYHQLSFNKPLGTYYVDDKAMTPKEFSELEITNIKTGWSGAFVEKRGDRIYKTDPFSKDAAKWYAKASSLINVPKIYSLIGDTLCMEYLESNGMPFKINDVIEVIKTFSLAVTFEDFKEYIIRVSLHCKHHNDYFYIVENMKTMSDYFNSHKSFMHGDLSIENIIVTDKGMHLIDPLYFEKGYSSYLLDISKMMCSLKLHNRLFEREIFLNKCLNMDSNIHKFALELLELTHFIRILKYAPTQDMKIRIKEIIKCSKL
jgi:capsule biosynthesis phosphatase